MIQSFICNEEQINFKIKSLKEAGASEGGTDEYFIDPDTKEHWILTSYESEQLDCDIQVLMQADITSEDLINIALNAADMQTVAAASLTLKYKEEHDKSEFRHSLISRLEEIDIDKLTSKDKERLKVIIYESDLYDGTNQRSIMNKHWTEIQKDAQFYQEPANKAIKILELIKE